MRERTSIFQQRRVIHILTLTLTLTITILGDEESLGGEPSGLLESTKRTLKGTGTPKEYRKVTLRLP